MNESRKIDTLKEHGFEPVSISRGFINREKGIHVEPNIHRWVCWDLDWNRDYGETPEAAYNAYLEARKNDEPRRIGDRALCPQVPK